MNPNVVPHYKGISNQTSFIDLEFDSTKTINKIKKNENIVCAWVFFCSILVQELHTVEKWLDKKAAGAAEFVSSSVLRQLFSALNICLFHVFIVLVHSKLIINLEVSSSTQHND